MVRQDRWHAAGRGEKSPIQPDACLLGNEPERSVDHQVAGCRQSEQPEPAGRAAHAEDLPQRQRALLQNLRLIWAEVQREGPGPVHQPRRAIRFVGGFGADEVQHVAKACPGVKHAGEPGDAVNQRQRGRGRTRFKPQDPVQHAAPPICAQPTDQPLTADERPPLRARPPGASGGSGSCRRHGAAPIPPPAR